MKNLIATLILITSVTSFANEIEPKSFGVQFLAQSITGNPLINLNFTIKASDFPSMNFTTVKATIVDTAGNEIDPGLVAYIKSISTSIVGSEVINFSYQDIEALQVIKNLKTSKLVMSLDNGKSFVINLSSLCIQYPTAFLNMNGGRSGCDVNTAAIDQLIQQAELEQKQKSSKVCNERKNLVSAVEMACKYDFFKEKLEKESNCTFICK